MKAIGHWLLTITGAFLLLFGLGCLNYTKAGGLEHHTRFAIEHGLPKPSEAILKVGAAAIMAGSGLLGYLGGSCRSCSPRTVVS